MSCSSTCTHPLTALALLVALAGCGSQAPDDTGERGANDTSSPDTQDDTGTTEHDGPPRTGRMHDFRNHAQTVADDLDSGAALIQINAIGLDGDGRIDLDGETGFVRRWVFHFHNPGSGHSAALMYMSASWTGDYPEIELDPVYIDAAPALAGPSSLPESDALAARFAAAPNCPGVEGRESDVMILRNDPDLGGNIVQFTTSSANWGASVAGQEFDGC